MGGAQAACGGVSILTGRAPQAQEDRVVFLRNVTQNSGFYSFFLHGFLLSLVERLK